VTRARRSRKAPGNGVSRLGPILERQRNEDNGVVKRFTGRE